MKRKHKDDRLCTLAEREEHASDLKHPRVIVRCSCGKSKEYAARTVEGYIFVCNGVVILRYREESAWSFRFKSA